MSNNVLACVDVDYRSMVSVAACLLFRAWTDDQEVGSIVEYLPPAAPYVSGQFYLRELPCVRQVLAWVSEPLTAIVIDGYVWLDGHAPGLGARLYQDIGVPIVGVAKRPFYGDIEAVAVHRGGSTSPLFVSSIGMNLDVAAQAVESMHGSYRIPT